MGGGKHMHPEGIDGYQYFQCVLKKLTGIDLTYYKDNQMRRRLTRYLQKERLPSFEALTQLIEVDSLGLEKLKDYLTINVTEFFRNPIRFDILEKYILPELKGRFKDLKVWSAGCSNGAEAYSLSILLEEIDPSGSDQILATDIDDVALREADVGIYTEEKIKEVSPVRKRRFFQKADQGWKINSQIRKRVRFSNHNLLLDPYPSNQHLILCRNVLIYFTDQAKELVYTGFVQSLELGGYLMIGGTESILQPKKYGLHPVGPFLYQRTEVVT
jgi:chemotaxis protein methyltransferase CheR